ncbi:transcriptional regulator [Metasolibacillus sp. FSL H7-0170]|uniref:transcriptional regulator n=1 Tax=Metasolibacillus TaxID=2703677 RepID=UPI000794C8AA|nr:transcriptional regulator [Metasolibacillus fluoroglycofenilyticus]KYG90264.1 transcriptional regulator [[Bacillus] sp. KCTC 13219]
MIRIQFMKPLYTRMAGAKLCLVFAYQHLSIMKEEELFHFIPLDGKEMVVNLKTYKIENVSDVFVFQNGSRFIRIPLYQLLLISNIYDYLLPIIEEKVANTVTEDLTESEHEASSIIRELEGKNAERLIDYALTERNETMFYNLVWHLEQRGML